MGDRWTGGGADFNIESRTHETCKTLSLIGKGRGQEGGEILRGSGEPGPPGGPCVKTDATGKAPLTLMAASASRRARRSICSIAGVLSFVTT